MEQTDQWRHAAIIKIAYIKSNFDYSQSHPQDESWVEGMCEIAADVLGLGRTATDVDKKIRAAIKSVGRLNIHFGWNRDTDTEKLARQDWERAIISAFFKEDN